jgi:hypothetical protein
MAAMKYKDNNSELEEPETAPPASEPRASTLPGARQNAPASKNKAQDDPTPDAESHIHPNVLDYGLEVPVMSTDAWIKIKPMKTFTCFIGDRDWHFVKDQVVKVPTSVALVV